MYGLGRWACLPVQTAPFAHGFRRGHLINPTAKAPGFSYLRCDAYVCAGDDVRAQRVVRWERAAGNARKAARVAKTSPTP